MLLDLAGTTTLRWDANVLKILWFCDFSGCFLFSSNLIFDVAPANLERQATHCALKSSIWTLVVQSVQSPEWNISA